MLSLRYREQLAEAFRAVDAGTITKTRERMDRRDNQRRAVADSPLGYRPERDLRGWLVVLAYAVATVVLCWFTKRGL